MRWDSGKWWGYGWWGDKFDKENFEKEILFRDVEREILFFFLNIEYYKTDD